MAILNLTQHKATPAQLEAGVVEPADKLAVINLITFSVLNAQGEQIRSLFAPEEIRERAKEIAQLALASGHKSAMVGGVGFLAGVLDKELRLLGIMPLYAYSDRHSVDLIDPTTGVVTKTSKFSYLGLIESPVM